MPKEGPNTIATRSLGDQNLLLVDEGHRGMSGKEEGVWFTRRSDLCACRTLGRLADHSALWARCPLEGLRVEPQAQRLFQCEEFMQRVKG